MADETRDITAAGATPLARLTRLELDEQAKRRMWEGIERRLTDDRVAKWGRVRIELRWVLAAVVTLVVAAGGALRWWSSQDPSAVAPLIAAGPLLTAEGSAFETLDATAGPRRVDFADGSSVEASSGALIEGLASTSSEFALFLRQGRVRVSVTPHGPRRWTIETRGARVEVVGTVFSVQKDPARVQVEVERGVVLVRSEALTDGVQRLSAGQVVAVGTPEALPAMPAIADAGTDPAPLNPRPETLPSAGSARTKPRAREPQLPSATELWEEADRARRAGDSARAASILERVLETHPRDGQTPLAAFTLGVLELEQLERPAAAARSFRRAIQLGVTGDLLESAYLRLGEALHRTKDAAGLRALLEQYDRRFPNGRYRKRLERWSNENQ